jgi:hypothetical protein
LVVIGLTILVVIASSIVKLLLLGFWPRLFFLIIINIINQGMFVVLVIAVASRGHDC